MGLAWTIDPQRALVSVRADGDIERPQIAALFDDIHARDAHRFRRLVDATRADPTLPLGDAYVMAAEIRERHRATGIPPGPLAVAVEPDLLERYRPLLGMIAATDRPFRLFTDIDSAAAWLEAPRIRNWSPRPARGRC